MSEDYPYWSSPATTIMVLVNTFGEHKASRRWAWHALNGTHHQVDCTIVQNRFRSGVRTAKTRTFPGAYVSNDHDLVNFTVRLEKIKKNKKQTTKKPKPKPKTKHMNGRLKLLKDPSIQKSFQATVGGKFVALLSLDDGAETLITKFSAVLTETANQILGEEGARGGGGGGGEAGEPRRKTQSWDTDEILDLCDHRRDLKKAKNTTKGAEAYREISEKIRKDMRVSKQDWIQKQCTEIEVNLSKNNSKRAFRVMKDLTQQRQSRVSTVQDKQGKCLTEK